MGAVQSRSARLARIAEILESCDVGSQAELSDALNADGYSVTQATLSRDLLELGAVKVRRGAQLVYSIPGDDAGSGGVPREEVNARLRRLCAELMISADASGPMVVLRTPPGAANYLAAAIDKALVSGEGSAIGTVAGDDTVLIVAADASGGDALLKRLSSMASGEGRSVTGG
ncbi:arginine repressor [Dermatophilus congolensis]|nr:arginine repressor [Dermatophilus congolensis]